MVVWLTPLSVFRHEREARQQNYTTIEQLKVLADKRKVHINASVCYSTCVVLSFYPQSSSRETYYKFNFVILFYKS